ncbi:Yga2G [Streptococcus pneumoniae]|nr:Yga2G [Streptococcus pneumoniae]VLF50826.1 Yga2G [Streptococcus pneumoniae]VLR60685.1 Yga2G [Streptococcus pneumoniae]
MKLTKVIINNFRSFGESQIIELNNQTVLIGNNSSGKTTVLQALSKLFSDKQNDRIIKKVIFTFQKVQCPEKILETSL